VTLSRRNDEQLRRRWLRTEVAVAPANTKGFSTTLQRPWNSWQSTRCSISPSYTNNDPSTRGLAERFGPSPGSSILADQNGILAFDQPHSLKLNATIRLHNGMDIGAAFQRQLGTAVTPLCLQRRTYGRARRYSPTAPLRFRASRSIDGFKENKEPSEKEQILPV